MSALLLGALTFASTGVFVSCTNYDDDLAGLESQIKAQQDLIAQLQDKIKNGDVIQSVTPISGGVRVTLSDGTTYDIVNGKDGVNGLNGQDGLNGKDGQNGKDGVDGQNGANGTVWEIDPETGYWMKDGVLTEYKAVGTDGTSATTPTIDIVDGYWVINGQNTGVKAVGVDGKDGQNGKDGVDGKDGQNGKDGVDGKDGQNGKDGVDGKDGQNGKDGVDGKDGKDGVDGKNGQDGLTPSIEISADGYWVINGVTSTVKAVGRDGQSGLNGQNGLDGQNGQDGANGMNGRYYVPNPETGCFDIYMDGVRVAVTEIPYMATGAVTAVLDQENFSVYGLTAGDVQVCLATYLRGLVFKPMIYLDGIETIEYPWLQDTTMIKTTTYTNTNRQGKVVRGLHDYVANYLPNEPKATLPGSHVFNYGPAWGVDYHMNPSTADVDFEDVSGWNVLEPQVLYVKTRAAAGALGVTSPEKNAAGDKIFKTSGGYVTAGLQIAHPELLNQNPTDLTDNKGDNTLALQINSKTSDGSKSVITSDYALLKGTKYWLEALVWAKAPQYAAGKTKNRLGDELGIFGNGYLGLETTNEGHIASKVHVWDSPEEALNDADGAALELPYNAADGINISSYLGIHAVHGNLATRANVIDLWSFGAEKKWGLSYEFNLIDYSVDGNVTHDSKYADWGKIGATAEEAAAAKAKGILVARNVKADGTTIDTESATAVDREPLVQVLVKNLAGEVVLDGYILVHITRTPAVEPDNKLVDNYPAQPAQFDLCNDKVVFSTNWSEFSFYVLTEKLENMTKEDFDANYEADLLSTNIGTTADGNEIDQLNIFSSFKKNGTAAASNDLGIAKYYPNWEGTTNHRFTWELSADELEKLTHDKANYPVEITRYIRFKEKAGISPRPAYPYIYVKMTVNITRKTNSVEYAKKNDNYWFGLDGADGGWDAIIFDVKEPTDGGDIIQINRDIRTTLLGNVEAIKNVHKYYFAPKNEQITALNGKKYTITAQSGAGDTKWNHIYCKYIVTPTADVHEWKEATLDEVIDKCAIDYEKGAFTNDKLYALYNGTYTQIATMDQATGEIALINNEQCDDILNAIGYTDDHKNIYTDLATKEPEMRTWVALVAQNECGVATKVSYEKASTGLKSFLVSWQRPINMKELAPQQMVDAKTNGNIIYVLDFLKLFDWRGEAKGYMWGDQQWFWAYYNVNYIKVNTNPSVVTTNMHNKDKFVALNTITTKAELYSYPSMTKGEETYNFSLTPTYDFASQNAALLKYMGISPANNANKEKFGAIAYYNNGDNVEEFDIRVPITIGYEWGEFTQTVQIKIKRTIQESL